MTIISKLDEMSFILENDKDASKRVSSVELLEALDPKLARTNNFMPEGSTHADLWIVRNGDPLDSVDAAFAAARIVEPGAVDFKILIVNGKHEVWMKSQVKRGPRSKATSYTLPAALTAAALQYQLHKDSH